MTKEELISKIKADGKENLWVLGALGDLGGVKGCNAHIESEELTANGWETKYYGIKTPFKGKVNNRIIDKVTITKRAFRELVMCLPLNFKRVIKAMKTIYTCEGGLKADEFKSNEFCPACREIVRVGWKMSEDVDLFYCFAMFLQFSNTYRCYLQDIFGELNKENFEKHPLTEILRLKRIVRYRAICENKKLEQLGWLVFLWVAFNKKRARQFVREMDIDKVKLDNDDMYYVLRRSSYNFGGLSLDQRLEMAKERDLREGNVILEI